MWTIRGKPLFFTCSSQIFTARKRSLGQGNIFAPVCHSAQGGSASEPPARETPLPGRPPCQGDPPAKETPCQGNPPAKETPLPRRPLPRRPPPPGRHPRGKLIGIRSRPTPKGEIEGDQIQVHTQGGNWMGSDPGPDPRWKLRGIRSRPTPKGEIQGDQVQANIQGEIEGNQDQTPPPRRLLLRAVRILLECILVWICFCKISELTRKGTPLERTLPVFCNHFNVTVVTVILMEFSNFQPQRLNECRDK